MARITDITAKDPAESTDKLLGSREDGYARNFELNVLRDYFLEGVINVGITSTSYPVFTDNGDGTGTIAGATVGLRDNSTYEGLVKEYSLTSDTFTFTDGVEEYIVADYNSGSPIYVKTTTRPNGSNTSLVYVVWRVGNALHSIHTDSIGNGLPNKTNRRLLYVEPYAVAASGGLLVSETSTPSDRTILVSSASVFAGVVLHSVDAFDSSVDEFLKVVNTGSGWTYTPVTQYNNTYFNTGSGGETEMANNKYAFNLYYRSIGDDKTVFFVEAENEYNSFEEARVASESGRSSIPTVLQSHCLFVGRTIFQKGATSGVTTSFIRTRGSFASVIPNHNDLTGLNGGIIGEYYHATSSEYSYVQKLPNFGDVSGGDYSGFETDGTLVAHGAATTWDDIQFSLTTAKQPIANAPTWSSFTTNLNKFTYAIGDYSELEANELSHSYKEGSDFTIHCHIYTNGVDGTDRTVAYELVYAITNRNGVASEITVTSPDFTIPASTTDRTHFIVPITTITGTSFEMGADISLRFRRVAASAGTAPSNAPFVSMVGVHIEQDTLGSRQETIK